MRGVKLVDVVGRHKDKCLVELKEVWRAGKRFERVSREKSKSSRMRLKV